MIVYVWRGLDRVGVEIALHHFTQIPLFMTSPTHHSKKATGEKTGIKAGV